MDALQVVDAVLRPGRGAPGAPVSVRFGTVTAVDGGAADVDVAGGTITGVPCYVAGVTEGSQVLLLVQGADVVVAGVRQ